MLLVTNKSIKAQFSLLDNTIGYLDGLIDRSHSSNVHVIAVQLARVVDQSDYAGHMDRQAVVLLQKVVVHIHRLKSGVVSQLIEQPVENTVQLDAVATFALIDQAIVRDIERELLKLAHLHVAIFERKL